MIFEISPEAKQRMRDERRSKKIMFGVSALAITGMVAAIVIDKRKGSRAQPARKLEIVKHDPA